MRWRTFLTKSSHYLFVGVFLLLVFSFAMFQGGFVSWFLFFSVSPFLIYALLLLVVKERFVLFERKMEPSHVESGQTVKVTLTMERKTRFPFIYMMAEELVGSEALVIAREKGASAVRFVGFSKKFEWHYELKNLPRGEHRFFGADIVFCDFFGWAQKKVTVDKEHVILVHPRVHEMQYVPLQTKFDVGAMASPYAVVKDTSMAVGLRKYEPGDRFSWIHWKSFAKTQTLQTKEFEDRQSQELLLMLNLENAPLFEEKVELAASILNTIVRSRGDVSLVTMGDEVTTFPVIQSAHQLEKVMYHLASLRPSEDAKSILRGEQYLKQIATLLYVTNSMSEELLHTLASSVKQCICLVVSEGLPAERVDWHSYKQVRVMYVRPNDYHHLFAEVMRS